MGSTGARAAVIAVVVLCAGVVGYLIWGAARGSSTDAVGELPTVADIVAAQAHQHGVSLPPLSEEEAIQLSAPPTTASTMSPFDQVRVQLEAVKQGAGLEEALSILRDVARESPVVAGDCARLYDVLVAGAATTTPLAKVCPG